MLGLRGVTGPHRYNSWGTRCVLRVSAVWPGPGRATRLAQCWGSTGGQDEPACSRPYGAVPPPALSSVRRRIESGRNRRKALEKEVSTYRESSVFLVLSR